MEEKVAVLTTSDIFKHWYPRIGLPIIAEIEASDGRMVKFASTGSLEKALEEGYTVYVVSTRSSLSTHDDWWLHMVDEDKVLLADAEYGGDFGEGWMGEEYVDKSNSAWINLYEKFGLGYPAKLREHPTDGEDVIEYTHWTIAKEDLREQGVKLGRDFRVLTPRQREIMEKMKTGSTSGLESPVN